MPKNHSTYHLGTFAETITKWYLRAKGYRILYQRYKTHAGEIDLIAKRRHIIAFIEVKARKSSTSFEGSISPIQQQRIISASSLFLAKHTAYRKHQPRFDAVFYTPPWRLRYIEHAWGIL